MLTQGPVSSPESTPLNYHELFKQLLQILIEFDNGTLPLSSPFFFLFFFLFVFKSCSYLFIGEKDLLSENSTKLLDEFANRYGIGTVSRLILYVSLPPSPSSSPFSLFLFLFLQLLSF